MDEEKGLLFGEAKDIPDQIVNIMIDANTGGIKFGNVEKAFGNLNLTTEQIKQWSDEERARTLYFVLRLKLYGFFLNESIMIELRKPLISNRNISIGNLWFSLAKKEQDLPFFVPCLVREKWDGVDYLAWKFGIGPRPTGIWAMVP